MFTKSFTLMRRCSREAQYLAPSTACHRRMWQWIRTGSTNQQWRYYQVYLAIKDNSTSCYFQSQWMFRSSRSTWLSFENWMATPRFAFSWTIWVCTRLRRVRNWWDSYIIVGFLMLHMLESGIQSSIPLARLKISSGACVPKWSQVCFKVVMKQS